MKSGVQGIYWHKRWRTWQVRNRQDVFIASFDEDDLDLAKECRVEAECCEDVAQLQRRWQKRHKPAAPKSLLEHPYAVKQPWGRVRKKALSVGTE